jgi:hypothetical protein
MPENPRGAVSYRLNGIFVCIHNDPRKTTSNDVFG